MISLIICSRTAEINATLQQNIAETIGYPFELVVIDNAENRYNIFEAYNLGVARSKGEYLCFMHDDISFHTKDWGIKLVSHFEDPSIGAIGIAGSPYVAQMPGTWWGGQIINQQLLSTNNQNLTALTKYADGVKANSKEVVVLDGVWICIRKDIFQKIKFDSENYSGFHFYDIDICLQVFLNGYKLNCVYDILIEHNSAGTINNDWIENALQFNEKWKKVLPLSCTSIPFKMSSRAELKTSKEFVTILVGNHRPEKASYMFAIKKIAHFYKGYLFGPTLKYLTFFTLKYLKLQKS